jgi:hypothetical protein
VKVTIHPHAVTRMRERGATRAEVEYTVKHGSSSPAKFDRTVFAQTFAYNRKWQGTHYRQKAVESYAVERDQDDWLVVTVIVKYF